MTARLSAALSLALLLATLAACGDTAQKPLLMGEASQLQLPAPTKTLLPTVNIAPAQRWENGAQPQPAAGLQVQAFASGLDHPRWLHVLPNGDVLVAETNAPPRPEDEAGLKGRAAKFIMKRAGAGVPSANRISLLRDADGDGVAEQRHVFLSQLNSPFGMALIGDQFYVANTDAVWRYTYREGQTTVQGQGTRVAELPAGARNHHWTKSLIASADGMHLYVAVGSNSNIAENGLDAEKDRAAILQIDPANGATRVFASGLRNPVGLAWQPDTGALWTAVNERDELGSDLVPDYMTSVQDGAFYGWPWSYFGAHVDQRVQPPQPERVAAAKVPDYALGAHTASLGLAYSREAQRAAALGSAFAEGMFVGQHGSWNRRPHSGYKVIFVPFAEGQPRGTPVDVLDGFLDADGKAQGRPVGVALDARGALLVADDVGNVIWRVSAAAGMADADVPARAAVSASPAAP